MVNYTHIGAGDIPPEHPVSVFNDVWQEMAGSGRTISWNAFSPGKIASVLPWILLLERQDNDKYVYRICGTECEQMFGMRYQGMQFDEGVSSDSVARRRMEFDGIEAGEGPLFSAATLPVKEKDTQKVYRGVFGLKADDGGLDKIAVVIAPQ